ncbi:craniofacial development protein 2-like [Elysia marginata]|uniref:Craniofacial development protein 2-like n=1 Tax=Elysia marginata TaxID=1093978 RepID=A0AAV4JJ39_9GAST|nr:craniofacial development protein 2-like [Elysia marginata]
MDRNKKDKSYVSEAGPPTVELAVKKNREEVSSLASTALPDDAPAPNPTLGRPRADCGSLKTRHRNFNIATWNVRTLSQCEKFENLVKEAELLKLDICGVSETRWTKSGHIDSENYRFVYSGAILQTYAPTSDYSDEDVDKYYEEVKDVLKEVKSSEVLIVMGDMNAKVGNQKLENIVGQHGLGCLFEDDRAENPPRVSNLDGLPIIATEVEHALRKMKNGKAPGLDNISTEILKALGDFGIVKLPEIFNHIYDSGHLPEDLLQSVFITLPKNQEQWNPVTSGQ